MVISNYLAQYWLDKGLNLPFNRYSAPRETLLNIRKALEKHGLVIEEKDQMGHPVGDRVSIHTVVRYKGERYSIVSIAIPPNAPVTITFALLNEHGDAPLGAPRAKIVLE